MTFLNMQKLFTEKLLICTGKVLIQYIVFFCHYLNARSIEVQSRMLSAILLMLYVSPFIPYIITALYSNYIELILLLRSQTILIFRLAAILSCQMDFRYYPVDVQVCPFNLRSCKYNIVSVQIESILLKYRSYRSLD